MVILTKTVRAGGRLLLSYLKKSFCGGFLEGINTSFYGRDKGWGTSIGRARANFWDWQRQEEFQNFIGNDSVFFSLRR